MRWIVSTDLADPSSPHADLAIEAASSVLWALSGRKYHGQNLVVEKYASTPHIDGLPFPFVAADGAVVNACSECGTAQHSLWLRQRPVADVQSVYVGEVRLDPSQYRVMDRAQIVSTGGVCWKSASEVTVAYSYGGAPPALGKMAAIELANELVKAAECSDDCRLPARVTSVSRQGVSWTLLDPQDFLEDGRTGIYLVDLFLKSTNPAKALARPRVFSPDLPRARAIQRTEAASITTTAHAASITAGEPFTLALTDVPLNVTDLSVSVTALDGSSWVLPTRMLSYSEGSGWSIVGTRESDTRLVPNRCTADYYKITGSLVEHIGRGTITRS